MTIFELVTRFLTERKGERATRLADPCGCENCTCGKGND